MINTEIKNKDISTILRDANNYTSYLWDKPRPKWDDKDFILLDKIKNNKIEPKEKAIRTGKPKGLPAINRKQIIRLSDNKIYNSLSECAKDGNPTVSSLSQAFKGNSRYKGILTRFKIIELCETK